MHTVCSGCGSIGPRLSTNDVGAAYDALRARLAEVEKERDGLKKAMRHINEYYDMPLRVKKVSEEALDKLKEKQK